MLKNYVRHAETLAYFAKRPASGGKMPNSRSIT